MSKPITPYNRLRDECRAWAWSVTCPKRVCMWRYPKERLREGWFIDDLYQRTAAAAQLGFRVELVATTDKGLEVWYVKNPGEAPWAIRPL